MNTKQKLIEDMARAISAYKRELEFMDDFSEDSCAEAAYAVIEPHLAVWRDIKDAPKGQDILAFWQYHYPSDAHPTQGFMYGSVEPEGFVDAEGAHNIELFAKFMIPKPPAEQGE